MLRPRTKRSRATSGAGGPIFLPQEELIMTILTQSSTARSGRHEKEPQDLLIRLIDWVIAAMERGRQRRALAALSDYQLHDIGLSRSDVAGETAKPFWRV
jgi:uncharacterized protein YjiS (DUF1127 family)